MVSGKPSKIKSFKSGKNVNYILVLLCLTLVFLGKLDLIAVRNVKAFLSDFLAPVTYALNKPVKEIAGVFEEVKSAGSLREENIRPWFKFFTIRCILFFKLYLLEQRRASGSTTT